MLYYYLTIVLHYYVLDYYINILLYYYFTILLYYYNTIFPDAIARVFLIILAAAPQGSRLLEPTAGVPKFGLRRLGGEARRNAQTASQERCGSVAGAFWQRRGSVASRVYSSTARGIAEQQPGQARSIAPQLGWIAEQRPGQAGSIAPQQGG